MAVVDEISMELENAVGGCGLMGEGKALILIGESFWRGILQHRYI